MRHQEYLFSRVYLLETKDDARWFPKLPQDAVASISSGELREQASSRLIRAWRGCRNVPVEWMCRTSRESVLVEHP